MNISDILLPILKLLAQKPGYQKCLTC